jgi:hypothetical protein
MSADLRPDEGLEPEEPWEAEVGSLLGRLPMVEPPEGFMAAALDHRPLRGGRTLLSLVALVVAAVAAVVGTDLIERTRIDVHLEPVVATLEVDTDEGEGRPDPDHPSSSVDRGDEGMSLLDRLTVVADAVTRQLGFPDGPD